MLSKFKETNRYHAQGSDGKKYEIIEVTELLDVTTIHDTQQKFMPGSISLKLKNGDHVNKISQGKYQVAKTGVDIEFNGP